MDLSPGAWGAPKRGMPTGSEAFLELPVALVFGPARGPTLKTALCHIRTLVGRRINIGTFWTSVQSVALQKEQWQTWGLFRHLVSTRLPSGVRAALLSPLKATLVQKASFATVPPVPVMNQNSNTTFFDGLSSFAQHIPKHNVLIIGGDMNAQISKDENNKFCLHNLSNRNGEYQAYQVERTFQESVWKPFRNHWQTYPKKYSSPTRHQTRTVYSGRNWRCIEKD